jgi:pimeloyl-ACP methyl ester carboxylesterase
MTAWSESDVQVNGITIHYYRTDGNKKPSILLLHGIAENGLCWSPVARDLASNYDVIMVDARGHGRSSSSTTDFSFALLADDVAGVIRALGLQKPYVWGHSMGAMMAATLAARYPDLIRAVVLEDPPLLDKPQFQTDVDQELLRTNEEQQNQSRRQWLLGLRALSREDRIARVFAEHPNWTEEDIILWADSKAELNIDFLEHVFATISDVHWREVISRIECPILLITGDPELHAIITPETAQQAAQLWKHGEVVYIGGAGHDIHRERYDETMAVVRAFLNRT